MSSNPWKVTCEFRTVADSKEQYDALVERLATDNKGKATQALVDVLKARRERIDAELQVRKCILRSLRLLRRFPGRECKKFGENLNKKRYYGHRPKCASRGLAGRLVDRTMYILKISKMM